MIKCLAVDDEPLALDIITSFIEKTPFLKLVARCENALDAIDRINKEGVDLLFLDIEMPDMTGIQFLKSLQKSPMVIFTTAYSEYALEGYEHNTIDYLLKPIPFDRFMKAANKAAEQHALHSNKSSEVQEFIYVKADYQITKIVVDDILYVEGLKDYIKIVTKEGKILTLQSLKAFEGELPAGQFMRIHRSFIVPFKKINGIRKNSIRIGEMEIPIGEKYKEEFLLKMKL